MAHAIDFAVSKSLVVLLSRLSRQEITAASRAERALVVGVSAGRFHFEIFLCDRFPAVAVDAATRFRHTGGPRRRVRPCFPSSLYLYSVRPMRIRHCLLYVQRVSVIVYCTSNDYPSLYIVRPTCIRHCILYVKRVSVMAYCTSNV